MFRRRPPDPPRPLVCRRCDGASGWRPDPDDGPASVCWPCIYQNGAAAGFPERLSKGEIALLTIAHGDVVEYVSTVVTWPRRRRVTFWRWTGDPLGAIA